VGKSPPTGVRRGSNTIRRTWPTQQGRHVTITQTNTKEHIHDEIIEIEKCGHHRHDRPDGRHGLRLASGATGAFFSDAHSGTVTGTIGSILVTPTGPGPSGSVDSTLSFSLDGLLPGVPRSATINYQNTGENPEHIWIVFDSSTVTDLNNNLGDSTVKITTGSGAVIWDSQGSTSLVTPLSIPGNLAKGPPRV